MSRLRQVAWGFALITFFVSTLAFSWPLQRELFVSPDENAAYTFAKTFAQTGNLAIHESLNEELGGILHPRSTIGFGNAILPASFIGYLVILGIIGTVFGNVAMHFVTPALAVVAILVWRDLIKKVFHHTLLADVAALFLMIHPAFWYYSGRVMMHNVAFLTLLIVGIWWLVKQPLTHWVNKQQRSTARLLDFLTGGFLFGVSLVIRTSEIFWVTAALAGAFVVYRAVIGWRATAMFIFGFVAALGLLAALNTWVYGAPLINGYTVKYPFVQIAVTPTPDDAVALPPLNSGGLYGMLLPFGFHEKNILDNVINYGWKLYPWMSALAAAGMIIVFAERDDQKKLWHGIALFTLVLAAWLGIVYGSWRIVDNPDPSIISLGNSHVRYWLPLFALASLFGARTIVYMVRDQIIWKRIFAWGLVALAYLLSLQLVFFGQDGFVPNRSALQSFEMKRNEILAVTEPNAIVVVDRADKYVFPSRRVVVPLRAETTYAALPSMLDRVPVYYFGITLPEKDMDYLNNIKLRPLGVQIEYLKTLHEESLYQFIAN